MPAPALAQPMRLLVSNDDGIRSPLLHALVAALRTAGHELFVVAPLQEQSWTGASKCRHRPVASAACDHGLGVPTWTVDGTPADCVNIALAHLLTGGPAAFDGVVTGINLGLNTTLGFINASGTIAAAWEGALHGLPAIACSQDLTYEDWHQLTETKSFAGLETARVAVENSAAHAARLAGELLPATGRGKFIVHNLNFPRPCTPATRVVRTVPARVMVPGLFSPAADDGTHRFVFAEPNDCSPPELITDLATVAAGHISHSILDYTRL
ncbi:MAG: 5'/3'-nucleotidase SurE [Verrucomicrobia bacterium]|nr:5'/3'-nucleotidase SurE [Verrucomicrobiota bacterium]